MRRPFGGSKRAVISLVGDRSIDSIASPEDVAVKLLKVLMARTMVGPDGKTYLCRELRKQIKTD